MTLEIDTRILTERLNGLYDALLANGQQCDAQQLVRDEAGRLIKTIVNFTPPLGPGGKATGARKAGELAIAKQLNSLFSEAEPDTITEIQNKYGDTNVSTGLTMKDGMKLPLNWANIDSQGNRMREFHHQYRRNGRVPIEKKQKGRWDARVVVPEGKRAPYVSKVQKSVGRWRASIAAALPSLQQHVPTWINRHFGSVQAIQILDMSMLNHPTQPRITFGTRAPGIDAAYVGRVNFAIKLRAKAMATRARMIIRGYGEDMRSGRKPTHHASKTSPVPQPPLE